jgi:hypothetical protein
MARLVGSRRGNGVGNGVGVGHNDAGLHALNNSTQTHTGSHRIMSG